MRTLWKSMVQRCTNQRNPSYARYGGRGIAVCDRWRSYAAFAQDVGLRPSMRHTLDRIDNDRGYEPGNVRWATHVEQGANRAATRLVTHDGRTQSIAGWARDYGLAAPTLWSRLRAGRPIGEALITPIDPRFTRQPGSKRTHGVHTDSLVCTPGGATR